MAGKRYFLLLLMFPLTGGLIMHHSPVYPAHCAPLSVLSAVSAMLFTTSRRGFFVVPSVHPATVGDDQQVSRNSQPGRIQQKWKKCHVMCMDNLVILTAFDLADGHKKHQRHLPIDFQHCVSPMLSSAEWFLSFCFGRIPTFLHFLPHMQWR